MMRMSRFHLHEQIVRLQARLNNRLFQPDPDIFLLLFRRTSPNSYPRPPAHKSRGPSRQELKREKTLDIEGS